MQASSPPCWTPQGDADRVMLGLSRVMRQMRILNERQGLDFGSVAVLYTVAHHAEGARISDIAAQIHLDLSTVSRHIRSLELSGHLAKHPDPQDGRAWLVSITDSGSSVLQDLMQQRAQAFATITSAWPADDTRTLADLLDRLSSSLESHLTPGADV